MTAKLRLNDLLKKGDNFRVAGGSL